MKLKIVQRAAAEVIKHRKAAAVEVLAKICQLLGREIHITRLGEIKKWVMEDLLTIELHDLVRLRVRVDTGDFLNHVEVEIFRIRVIVVPRGLTVGENPIGRHVKLNSRKDEFRVRVCRHIRNRL